MEVVIKKQTRHKDKSIMPNERFWVDDATGKRWVQVGIAEEVEVKKNGDISELCDNDRPSELLGYDSAITTSDKHKNVDEGKRTSLPNHARKNNHK